jgi:hypothetical protein
MKKDKARKPIMADRFLASPLLPHPFPHRAQNRVRDALRAAKRFVLNEEACRYVGEIVRDVPEAIAHAQEFALLPFPVMYVEFANFKAYFETVNGSVAKEDSDACLGYVYEGPRVYAIADAPHAHSGWPMLTPISYRLHQPFTMQEELDFCAAAGTNRLSLDVYMWGKSYEKIGTEERRALRAEHSIEWLAHPDALKPWWSQSLYASAGEMRNIVAALLLLNQPSELRYEETLGPVQGMVRNKVRAFLSHSVIRFPINPVPRIKRALVGGKGGELWRREHDVRGHFCHSKTARTAAHNSLVSHEWVEYGPNQWRCKLCGGLRWWRRECRRGTKHGAGRVTAEYEVVRQ